MSKPLAIGIDVGGTKLACALVDRQGQVLRTTRLPTNAAEGAAAVIGRIAEGIGILLRDAPGAVDGIGIGAPGQVDPVHGTVSHAVNLGWNEVALVSELRKRLPDTPPIYINI
jgi:glucokinase